MACNNEFMLVPSIYSPIWQQIPIEFIPNVDALITTLSVFSLKSFSIIAL